MLLALVFRLPHLLSRASVLDGDESIIGIMANDLLAGKKFPIYFYGQQYGFSMFEVWTSAFWISILGKGIWALRLGALMLFSLGATFIWKGLLLRKASFLMSFLFTVGILSFPTWYIWGMLPRGGYVTAFVAVGVVFYLTSAENLSYAKLIVLFSVLAIGFEAHSLLLFSVFPFLLMDWLQKKYGIVKLLLCFVGFVLSVLLFRYLNTEPNFWQAPQLHFVLDDVWKALVVYLENILHAYTNFFVYPFNLEIPYWWAVLATISLTLILLLFVYLLATSKKATVFYIVLWVFLQLLLLMLIGSIQGYSPRYFISFFSGFMVLFMYLHKDVFNTNLTKIIGLVILLIFTAGIGSGSKIKRCTSGYGKDCYSPLNSIYESASKSGVKGVYMLDDLLQWQWNYLYGSSIPATCFRNEERINDYLNQVDLVYRKNRGKVAVIGWYHAYCGLNNLPKFNESLEKIDDLYFIQTDVTSAIHDSGYVCMGQRYDSILAK